MQFKQFLGAVLAIVAARAQDAPANLTSVLAGNDNLSSLVSLLESNPDVAEALSSASNITILAPSNEALNALNNTNSSSAAQQEGFLQALLNYHVLVGSFSSENITETPAFPATLLNDTAFANVTGGQVVECRVEDDEVIAISGFKNNVTVTEAVSINMSQCQVYRSLHGSRTLPLTVESFMSLTASSLFLQMSVLLLKRPDSALSSVPSTQRT